jgi:hypothetical protein
MEWLAATLISLVVFGGIIGSLVLYIDQNHQRYLQRRLLFERRMEIYEHIAATVSRIKEIINFASGDNTVRQWKKDVMAQLNDLRCNAYTWSIFLPEGTRNAPIDYADAITDVLLRLDGLSSASSDVRAAAEIIDEVTKVEKEAADRLRDAIGGQLLG